MTRDADHPESAKMQFATCVANLRHAYYQLDRGSVIDQRQFARGLLGPTIESLEQTMVDGVAGDRLQTIIDEEWGPFPTAPVDQLLTKLEHHLFEDRRTRIELSNNLDAAHAAIAATEASIAEAFKIAGGDEASIVAAVQRLKAERDAARAAWPRATRP